MSGITQCVREGFLLSCVHVRMSGSISIASHKAMKDQRLLVLRKGLAASAIKGHRETLDNISLEMGNHGQGLTPVPMSEQALKESGES